MDIDEYIVNLPESHEVNEVSFAIGGNDEPALRPSCFAIEAGDYGLYRSEVDFGSASENFEGLRIFFEKAALHGRAVVFTVDQ